MTTMHQLAINPLKKTLKNLKHILQKGAEHGKKKEFEDQRLTSLRLFPDMLPLRSQVYIATDVAKFAAARLSGAEAPSYEDNEETFDELIARIDKTLAFIESVPSVDGSEEKEITMKFPHGEMKFSGRDYVQHFVIPNVYFHTTTAYGILRSNGVELGKMDFLKGGV